MSTDEDGNEVGNVNGRTERWGKKDNLRIKIEHEHRIKRTMFDHIVATATVTSVVLGVATFVHALRSNRARASSIRSRKGRRSN